MADEHVHVDGSSPPPPAEMVHLPGPSFLPVVVAFGLTLLIAGVVLNIAMVVIGAVITVAAVWRWIRETRQDIAELPLHH
jgi:membrane protein implicated in regulation of membrane protease activity